jgi:hypothetical protein
MHDSLKQSGKNAVKKDSWDKLKAISAVIAALLIPLVVAFVGNGYNAALKKAELEHQYVELSVAILTEEPTADNKNLRDWAIKNLNTYSEIKFDATTTRELRDKIKLAPIELRRLGGIETSPRSMAIYEAVRTRDTSLARELLRRR